MSIDEYLYISGKAATFDEAVNAAWDLNKKWNCPITIYKHPKDSNDYFICYIEGNHIPENGLRLYRES